MLHFRDIDDPRNGLLLYKPIEWAFDTSRLAIIYDPNIKGLCVRLLDRDKLFLDTRLQDKAQSLLGREFQPLSAAVHGRAAEATFRDLEREQLKFVTGHRPYYRCLYFHACRVRAYGRLEGWAGAAELEFDDFASEELMMQQDRLSRLLNFESGTRSSPSSDSSEQPEEELPRPLAVPRGTHRPFAVPRPRNVTGASEAPDPGLMQDTSGAAGAHPLGALKLSRRARRRARAKVKADAAQMS